MSVEADVCGGADRCLWRQMSVAALIDVCGGCEMSVAAGADVCGGADRCLWRRAGAADWGNGLLPLWSRFRWR